MYRVTIQKLTKVEPTDRRKRSFNYESMMHGDLRPQELAEPVIAERVLEVTLSEDEYQAMKKGVLDVFK